MNNRKLLKKLKSAYVVCSECGSQYGTYSVGCSSVWEGICDVCGETKPITESRDWGYLQKGITELNKAT
jgi:translation initiation factor 2 beta subunit (eIF-2beta)/eIF-5